MPVLGPQTLDRWTGLLQLPRLEGGRSNLPSWAIGTEEQTYREGETVCGLG